jgi:transcriptional regulator with XRE-family HTH domain
VSDTLNPPDPTSALIAAISRLRREANYTLEDLADIAGLHRTSLGLIERGERGLTIDSASRLATALGVSLSSLVALAEAENVDTTQADIPSSPRRLDPSVSRNEKELLDLTGLDAAAIRSAVEYTYDTLDLIDAELVTRGAEPISRLVELANLSSMVGNLLGAGLAKASNGLYVRNRPHAFPDLVPQRGDLPNLEIKTALETNRPKGHLPKPGVYLTFRYALGHADGSYRRGKLNLNPPMDGGLGSAR